MAGFDEDFFFLEKRKLHLRGSRYEELGEDIVVDDEVDEGSLIVGEGQLLISGMEGPSSLFGADTS